MKRYTLNFAAKPRPDWLQTILRTAPILILLLILIAGNIEKLITVQKKIAAREDELTTKELREKIFNLKNQIDLQKKNWQARLKNINNLLEAKNSPLIDYLDLLEETIPDGVAVQSFKFSAQTPSVLELTIITPSAPDLKKAYAAWKKYQLNIIKESESSGMLVSQLTLNFNHYAK